MLFLGLLLNTDVDNELYHWLFVVSQLATAINTLVISKNKPLTPNSPLGPSIIYYIHPCGLALIMWLTPLPKILQWFTIPGLLAEAQIC